MKYKLAESERRRIQCEGNERWTQNHSWVIWITKWKREIGGLTGIERERETLKEIQYG